MMAAGSTTTAPTADRVTIREAAAVEDLMTIPDEDEEEIIGTYCRGCLKILDEEDIDPGQHEQYTLMEGEA